MRNIVLSLALAGTCLAAGPALAAEARIAWNDLDLSTAAGKAELDRRIDAAARELCTHDAITGSRIAPKPSARCLADARGVISAKVAARTNGANRLAAAPAANGRASGGAAAEAR